MTSVLNPEYYNFLIVLPNSFMCLVYKMSFIQVNPVQNNIQYKCRLA